MLARVNALSRFPAYGLSVIGYAIDGPRTGAFGPSAVFGVGAVYGLASGAAVLALRSVRAVRWDERAGVAESELVLSRGAAEGGERGQPGGYGDDDRERQHLGQVGGGSEGHDAERDGDPAHGHGERGRDPRRA
jgi:hypothetical protein